MTAVHKSIAAGALVLVLGGAARWLNGVIYSSAKAEDLIDALSSSALYLGSAMVGGSATILALMLTLVGLVRRVDGEFNDHIYVQIVMVSRLSAISLGASVALLLVLAMPVGEFENLPTRWYPTLYNILYGMVLLLSALLCGTVMLLYQTVRELIAEITPTEAV